MCSIAIAGLAFSVAGGVMQYTQQKQQGANQQALANYQAQSARINAENAQAEADYRAAIDRNNAKRAEYLAEDAIARGEIAEQQERLRGRLLVGQMRAVLAGNGVLVDDGSAESLVIDQSQRNETDAQNVRNNAEREAQEFRIQAGQFDSQAYLSERAGQNIAASGERDAAGLERNGAIARSEANSKATGSLLSSAGSVASKWYSFKKDGAFNWSSPSSSSSSAVYAWGT